MDEAGIHHLVLPAPLECAIDEVAYGNKYIYIYVYIYIYMYMYIYVYIYIYIYIYTYICTYLYGIRHLVLPALLECAIDEVAYGIYMYVYVYFNIQILMYMHL
jgi:uncharacterized Fe-S radical SAM superfamily protein PflX